MAEEVIKSVIEKLETWESKYIEYSEKAEEIVEEVKNELKLILDLIVEKDSGNKLINDLIADVVDMAQDSKVVVGSDAFMFTEPFWFRMNHILIGLRKRKEWILELGGEEAGTTSISQTVGDEGDRVVVGLEEIIESLLRDTILPIREFKSYNLFTNFNEEKVILEEEKLMFNAPFLFLIMGLSGIGKTTLARELYNHAAVADRFQQRAWVRVSGGKSNKQVLRELIEQVVEGEEIELLQEMDNESLQQMLCQHLENKHYLIVLDDVDEDSYLISFFKALPQDFGSMLLVTTRSPDLRLFDDYDHRMEFLDGEKSWELFLKTIFHGNTSDQSLPPELEENGRKMLEQCGGLPLAIVDMGTELALKRESGGHWDELLESIIDFTQTLTALELSYHLLPPKAKSLFPCLAFFEEGTIIRIEKLMQIGVAQLVISEEEVDGTLDKMVEHSYIEIMDKNEDGSRKYLKIKTIFHRLAVKIAEKQINFEIVRNNEKSQSSRKPLHRAVYCSQQTLEYSSMDQDEDLVSLFFRGSGSLDAATSSFWDRFERLVTLDMESFGLTVLPEEIGRLTRLKYLGLRNNQIKKLPLSLRFLKDLQVLDIALNFNIEVPNIIWEMISLRHLYMSNIICSGPLKIDSLENLETLTYISVENWEYELSGLLMMTILRKLGIEDIDANSDLSKLFASLRGMKNLENLTLRGFQSKRMPLLDEIGSLQHLTTLTIYGILTRLPSADNFPASLGYLTLVDSCLDEDPMPVLESLFRLQTLVLKNAYTGEQMVISDEGFYNLNILRMEELWNLRNIQVGEFQSLSVFEINDCPNLEDLPEVKSLVWGFQPVINLNNSK